MSREQKNDRLLSREGEEEWINITDPQERKRVQNRVSQRNYRRRLKHRIEDLERETARSHAILGLNLEDIIRPGEAQQGYHVFPIQTTPKETNERNAYEKVMNENKISTPPSQLEQPFQLRRDALGNLAGLSSSWISSYDPNNRPRENFLGADFQDIEPYTPAPSTSSCSSAPSMSSFLLSQLPNPVVPSNITYSRTNFSEEPIVRLKSATVRPDSDGLREIRSNASIKAIGGRLGNNSNCTTTDNRDSGIDWQFQPLFRPYNDPDAPLPQKHTREHDPVCPSNERPLEERFTHILLNTLEAGFKDIDSMILQYYTETFRYDSVIHWAQKRSRMERLMPLLIELSKASASWGAEEAEQYKDAILKVASCFCASDVDVDTNTPQTDGSTTHILSDGL
ncbi:hypothetical protein M441DRAFT_88859 [Trichoderma asperellum CBS 433.97]|uniref:BZIP domain-containing protein n=1 Tax=Trichoderma asperellum (strain ATCC 204424 / CBS 433.97 / NBRC 101777) TaxID=1042311 RepID=A0A2T3ZCA8_TRIA4|nr:hypothetical protein M441DRAFT_88859 [Trichoderma asperellum CBS 433.97]PTB42443.1 hypothetical protein M441DRAFT_88859 [Trichoderma asperellum CBS 433.97]